jgi:ribose transport system permease protein
MIGAILIASVSDGMNVMNVSSYWQPLVIGVIILTGVMLDTHRRSLTGQRLGTLLTRLWRSPSATKTKESETLSVSTVEKVAESVTLGKSEQ